LRAAAAIYASVGRSEDARKIIARALQLDPDMRASNLKDRLMMLQPEHLPNTPKRFAGRVAGMRMSFLMAQGGPPSLRSPAHEAA
jgi:hypothetical protein